MKEWLPEKQILKEHGNFFDELKENEKRTLRDDQTTLVVVADQAMYLVKVDGGIITENETGVRKCDYLAHGCDKAYTHLIELKGKEIEEAYTQLTKTVENLSIHYIYNWLVNDRDRIDAFIVSPNTQNIPKGINSKERILARLLFNRSRDKIENMLDLINYVKVVPKQEKISCGNRRIICSGKAPLPLE